MIKLYSKPNGYRPIWLNLFQGTQVKNLFFTGNKFKMVKGHYSHELSYRLSKNKMKCLPKLRSKKRNFALNKTSFFKFGLIEIPLKTGPIVSYIYI